MPNMVLELEGALETELKDAIPILQMEEVGQRLAGAEHDLVSPAAP